MNTASTNPLWPKRSWRGGARAGLRTLIVALALAAVWLPSQAAVAGAAILPGAPIDGPAAEVLELGDVAMSDDGSGGVVYVRKLGDRQHIYAALYRDGNWATPQRVDVGQEFDSFSPRIAAGDGGRVVVVWIQQGPVVDGLRRDELHSATVDPGATAFEPPVPIDLDVGPQWYVTPDIAMNRGGQALVAYRVVEEIGGDGGSSLTPVGYAIARLRVARFNGWTWSSVDQDLNRNPATPVVLPSPDNAPRIGIERGGNGVIAFQEPDDEFIARVWLRRLFGNSPGLALLASPTEYAGQPLRGEADRISLDVGIFGNAAVAFRQAPGNPSGLDRSRIFVNLLPDVFTLGAGAVLGARPADLAPTGSGQAPLDPVVGVTPAQRFVSLYGFDGEAHEAFGSDVSDPVQATPHGPAAPAGPSSAFGLALAADETRTLAWAAGSGSSQSASIRVRDASGSTTAAAELAAPTGGAVGELKVAGNQSGDALIALRQLAGGESSIVVSTVDSPPDRFVVFESDDWLKVKRPRIQWEPSFDAIGGASYEVRVDGRLAGNTTADSLTLSRRVKDGRHRVAVTATDRFGQPFAGAPVILRLDRRAPKVLVKKAGRRKVRVVIRDGRRLRAAGVSRRTLVRWGDGRRSRVASTKTYRYKRGGRVRISIIARDRAGNVRRVRRWIRL
ncbi:MAG: hypothetical protein WAO61_05695 [Solirubrobacterales bacterium]